MAGSALTCCSMRKALSQLCGARCLKPYPGKPDVRNFRGPLETWSMVEPRTRPQSNERDRKSLHLRTRAPAAYPTKANHRLSPRAVRRTSRGVAFFRGAFRPLRAFLIRGPAGRHQSYTRGWRSQRRRHPLKSATLPYAIHMRAERIPCISRRSSDAPGCHWTRLGRWYRFAAIRTDFACYIL